MINRGCEGLHVVAGMVSEAELGSHMSGWLGCTKSEQAENAQHGSDRINALHHIELTSCSFSQHAMESILIADTLIFH